MLDQPPMNLDGHVGSWSGTWSTWLEPDVVYDSAPLEAEIAREGDGWVIRYHGAIADEDVSGSMVVRQTVDGVDIRWTDPWHTAGATEVLIGSDGALPSYRYGPADEAWTWSIQIEVTSDRLAITHWNTPPGGDPGRAVAMILGR